MKTLVVSLAAVALVADISVGAQAPQATQDISQLRKAAERGDGDAQYRLGVAYWDGAGVARDVVEAHVWLSLASNFASAKDVAAYSEASAVVTAKLTNAQILESNARTVAYLERLAKAGNATAQFLMGISYHSGVQGGVKQDYAQALTWLQKAAAQKHVKAEFLLGLMYLRGDGVAVDRRKGVDWMRKAGAQGDALAQHTVGTAYFTGDGLPQDFTQAVVWWRKAAEQGIADAQFDMGDVYEAGNLGVPRDYREAVRWYRMAAEQGHTGAQFRLGSLHARGLGVLQDGKIAFEWYRLAAERGNTVAQFNLAMMYLDGKSIPQDLLEAYKWANLAAARGPSNLQAQFVEGREAVAKLMTPAEIAEAQARARDWSDAFERLLRGEPPPPPPPPPPVPSGPLRTGGEIPVPKKIKHVDAVYPPFAISARIQGVVIIEAEIGIDGRVISTKVLHSPSILLEGPALDAVKQWQFEPTLWRGSLVPVIATATVDFKIK